MAAALACNKDCVSQRVISEPPGRSKRAETHLKRKTLLLVDVLELLSGTVDVRLSNGLSLGGERVEEGEEPC